MYRKMVDFPSKKYGKGSNWLGECAGTVCRFENGWVHFLVHDQAWVLGWTR